MCFVRKVASVNLNAMNVMAKKMLLKEFVIKNDLDVVFLQEVLFDNFGFIPTHHALVNISETNKGTAILVRKSLEISDFILDPCGRITSVVVDDINFVNVYGHAGSQYKAERDVLFEQNVTVHMCKRTADAIVGGDFNCILETDDCRSNNKNLSRGLLSFVNMFGLKDVECKLKGKNKQFTFYRNDSASRLDRFYAPSNLLKRISGFQNIPVPFSDHRAVVFRYNIDPQERPSPLGRGYWKVNNSLLKNEDISNEFTSVYIQLRNRRKYRDNFAEWWGFDVKNKIQQFYKSKSYTLNKQRSLLKEQWHSKLVELSQMQSQGQDLQKEISYVKAKILEAEYERLQSYGSRFQPNTLLESEKISLYQVSRIFKNKLRADSFVLKTDVSTFTSPTETKQFVFEHYKQLFSEKTGRNSVDPILNSIKKTLSSVSKDLLTQPITEEELRNTVNMAAKKKSPGPDGITYEFYATHFHIIKQDLLKLFNGFLSGTLKPLENFSSGIITLIPKVGSKYDINNYRPISLLNTDYKLLNKIIARRLSISLGELIGEGQTAGFENKSSIDNLDAIRSLVVKAQQSKRFKFALLSLDLQKAFDTVNHRCLWEILKKFDLPVTLVNFLQRIYQHASSRVLVNGFLTQSFKISRSVRQGCPLSMILFSLYIEPLIREIDSGVSGILFKDRFLRVLAYADDLTIIVRNDPEFDKIMQILSTFSDSADIQLNFKKSAYLRYNNCPIGPQLIREESKLRILGLLITTCYKEIVNLNYDRLIQNINIAVRTHLSRRLSLIEKVLILNTYMLSKLWYIAQIIPPNNVHVAQIRKITGSFLWGPSRIFKIERSQLYLHNLRGGLNLIDTDTQCKSLFIRNLLFKNNRPVTHFLIESNNLKALSLNTQKFILEAKKIKNNVPIDKNKQIYDYFLNKLQIKCKIEQKYPQVAWDNIWENISQNYLSIASRSILYELFNDIIPNNVKLYKHIANTENFNCVICGKPDNNEHRIRYCTYSVEIWNWVSEIIKNRFKINIEHPHRLLYLGIGKKNHLRKAALWLVS